MPKPAVVLPQTNPGGFDDPRVLRTGVKVAELAPGHRERPTHKNSQLRPWEAFGNQNIEKTQHMKLVGQSMLVTATSTK